MELTVQNDLSVLLALAQHCGEDLVLYLFGSVARNCLVVVDLDVLAIYEREDSLRAFRTEAMGMDLTLPLHLIAMTPAEEQHYQFIARSDARRIAEAQWQPSSLPNAAVTYDHPEDCWWTCGGDCR
jgi:hypothetical protein